MKTGYLVYGNDGMNTNLKGIFMNEDDAKKAARGFGFWGSDGKVKPVQIYETYDDYEDNK